MADQIASHRIIIIIIIATTTGQESRLDRAYVHTPWHEGVVVGGGFECSFVAATMLINRDWNVLIHLVTLYPHSQVTRPVQSSPVVLCGASVGLLSVSLRFHARDIARVSDTQLYYNKPPPDRPPTR